MRGIRTNAPLILPLDDKYRLLHEGVEAASSDELFDVTYKFLHDRVQQAAYSLIEDRTIRLSVPRVRSFYLQQSRPNICDRIRWRSRRRRQIRGADA